LSPHQPFQASSGQSPDGPEHVAAHDPGANIVEPALREVVVNTGRSAVHSEHLSKGAGGKSPIMQRDATDPERIVEVLAGTGAIAVDRNGEAVDAELGHR
jgi:hypothetical protein